MKWCHQQHFCFIDIVCEIKTNKIKPSISAQRVDLFYFAIKRDKKLLYQCCINYDNVVTLYQQLNTI